ncbi:hypothetical protein OnM2_021115 [Erysiphe neolycopersici]|uniref:Uncharacterized protein n=1 Tax=Erysiphe neolycopersici TaxID=212602 RepID=A0A420I2Y7_9PEZI|nr:hypothetical protein OnM2_021115 [Erysiphe neolycopersici]
MDTIHAWILSLALLTKHVTHASTEQITSLPEHVLWIKNWVHLPPKLRNRRPQCLRQGFC